MKIRMKDNTLRLRLMQTEVDQFLQEGYVKSTTSFGPLDENSLSYTLQKTEGIQTVSALFEEREIKVLVPEQVAETWSFPDQVGFEVEMPLKNNDYLYILVEKDFKCLQERPHEDESDSFPNPLEGIKC